MKTSFIINPNSGPKSIIDDLDSAINLLSKNGFVVSKLLSGSSNEAKIFTKKAIENQFDLVVAVGGDGTVNEICNNLVHTKIPLAIIPTGTANVFAKELGLASRGLFHSDFILKAAEIILAGKKREIDLGKVKLGNGIEKYFVMWCGVGLDAKFTDAKNIPPKSFYGRQINYFKWLIKVIKISLSFSGEETTLISNDEKRQMKLFQAIICNGSLYANYFKVSNNSRLDDGLLNLLLIKDNGKTTILKYFFKSILGHQLYSDSLDNNIKHISIKSENPLPVHVDAETIGTTPIEIEVIPKAITVIVP